MHVFASIVDCKDRKSTCECVSFVSASIINNVININIHVLKSDVLKKLVCLLSSTKKWLDSVWASWRWRMKLEEKNGGRHLTTNHLHNLKGKLHQCQWLVTLLSILLLQLKVAIDVNVKLKKIMGTLFRLKNHPFLSWNNIGQQTKNLLHQSPPKCKKSYNKNIIGTFSTCRSPFYN